MRSQLKIFLGISSLHEQGVLSPGKLNLVPSFKAVSMSLSDWWNNGSGGGTVKSIVPEGGGGTSKT